MLLVKVAAAIEFNRVRVFQWRLYRMQLSQGDGRMARGGFVRGSVPRHGLELVWVATAQFSHHGPVGPTTVPEDSAGRS
jgi:hypothetical protein